jgi:hypothetical protein
MHQQHYMQVLLIFMELSFSFGYGLDADGKCWQFEPINNGIILCGFSLHPMPHLHGIALQEIPSIPADISCQLI